MGLEERIEGVGCGFGEDVWLGGIFSESRVVVSSEELEPG